METEVDITTGEMYKEDNQKLTSDINNKNGVWGRQGRAGESEW